MRQRGTNSSKPAAFSVLELLVTIVVIGILAVLLIPAISFLRARAQRAQCASNLRNLQIAANLYIQQNGNWPQIRLAGSTGSESAARDYANAWISALEPFGPTRKTWICPTIQALFQNPDYSTAETARTDYFAMPFDPKPMTPHQWARQPWFVESGDVHGHGNLIIFTDGSISDLKTLVGSTPH